MFSQPSFEAILPLMDNYIPDVHQNEDHSAEEELEEERFLNVVVGKYLLPRFKIMVLSMLVILHFYIYFLSMDKNEG